MDGIKPIAIAVLGLGTVGTGVVKALTANQSQIEERVHFDVRVKRCLVRDLTKPRGVTLPAQTLTTNPDVILQDPEIDVVVEVIGGVEPSLTLISRALSNRKHVITANKELLAKYGDELTRMAQSHGVRLMFEASVGGGIPIVRMVESYLTANRIYAVRGILNGTSNYILTQMEEQEVPFVDALAEAQRLGYAEADPESDIEGYDAAYKLSILANMAFPVRSVIGQVDRQGISQITLSDMHSAKHLQAAIKLIGHAVFAEGRVTLSVGPRMLSAQDPLAGVRDVFNAVTISADVVGDLTFIGRGAGELPTASAVIEDLMEILRAPVTPVRPLTQQAAVMADSTESEIVQTYYVRATLQSASRWEVALPLLSATDARLWVPPHGSMGSDLFIGLVERGTASVLHQLATELTQNHGTVLTMPFDGMIPDDWLPVNEAAQMAQGMLPTGVSASRA